jgi:hypothetical protein
MFHKFHTSVLVIDGSIVVEIRLGPATNAFGVEFIGFLERNMIQVKLISHYTKIVFIIPLA